MVEGDDDPAASEDAGMVSIALDGTEVDPGVGNPECTVGLTGGPSRFAFNGDAAELSVDYDADAGALRRVALQVDRGDGDWDVYRQADGALETATAEFGETQLRGEVTLTPVTTSTEPGDVAMAFEIAC